MQILATSRTLQKPVGPFAVGIGIFDGVHLGHQALLSKVTELAKQDVITSLAYTFNPHPARVLVPDRAPKLLEPMENRLEGFAALGLEACMVERFDQEFADFPARYFVDFILVDKLRVKHVVIGEGFTFGAEGSGTTELLEQMGKQAGYETHVIEPVRHGGEIVSSTRIRSLIEQGDVAGAAELLGRPFALSGSTRRGVNRGAKLGFPTANLKPDNETLPGKGVYAARACGAFGDYGAVVNVGYTPTFGSDELKIEAHLLGFESRPLYGAVMSLELIDKLRDEQRFDGPEALVQQINQDIEKARQIMAS